MAAPDTTLTYEVQLDIYLARRKRMHAVFDPGGVPVFHAPLVMHVLTWLTEKDVTEARFTDEESTFLVKFSRVVKNNPNAGD